MEDLDKKIIELMDLFDDEQVTTADKIDRPQQALDRDMYKDFMDRNPQADGGRAGYSVGSLVGLAPRIPGVQPLLRKGAEALTGTVLGKRIADTFFPDAEEMEKEKEKLKEMTKPIGSPAEPSIEIGTTTGEKPEVKIDTKEVFPAGENIKPVAGGFPADTEQLPIIFESKKYSEKALKGIESETLTDLNKIIKDYRDSKTRKAGPVTTIEDGRVRVRERPASTQPIMSEADKVELLNLVIDKYKEKENKLPDATQLTVLLPSLNVSSLAKRNDIELGKRPTGTYDRNDPVYIATQRENKQLKANENNTITNFADENFFPNTIQLKDGSIVNAEKFFIDNLAKRTELGPSRLGTYDIVLKNKELAKLFNTNERKIEEVIKNIRKSPDFQAEYPPPRSKNYANEEAAKILKDAREYAKTLPNGELHVQNVLIQERKRIPDLNNLFKDGTLKITDYPRLVEDLNTTMDKKTGIIDKTITKTEKEMTERAMKDKGLFQVFHNVPKSSRQKNIEFLSNRYLSLYKTNVGFVKSAEAYIKNQKDNPDYKERVEDFDNYLKERGLRIKIDNKFYGIDFQEMINSDTGEFTGMNRTLEYYGLPKFENGVPLKKVKKAEGGPVNIDLTMPKFATGGRIGFESGTIPGGYTDDAYAYLREIDDEIFNSYKKYKAGGGRMKYGQYAYNAKRQMFGPFGVGVGRLKRAGGGLLKQAGDRSGPPPERGPNPQGLPGLLKRVKNI